MSLQTWECDDYEFNCSLILIHVQPLLGNGLVSKFPRRQILGKQSVARPRNNRTNAYSSFLRNNQRANGLARYLLRDLFSVWSAPCPVLSNRIVNTSTIIGVFYDVRAESWEAISQGHEAVTEKSLGEFSSWEYKDENGTCPSWTVKIDSVRIRTEEYTVIEDKTS
jgi:hypothetical protein